jgi:hypothetical protein
MKISIIIIKRRELSKMFHLNSITAAVYCFNYLRCEISYKKLCKHCSTQTSRDVRDQWVIKDVGIKLDFEKKLAD